MWRLLCAFPLTHILTYSADQKKTEEYVTSLQSHTDVWKTLKPCFGSPPDFGWARMRDHDEKEHEIYSMYWTEKWLPYITNAMIIMIHNTWSVYPLAIFVIWAGRLASRFITQVSRMYSTISFFPWLEICYDLLKKFGRSKTSPPHAIFTKQKRVLIIQLFSPLVETLAFGYWKQVNKLYSN